MGHLAQCHYPLQANESDFSQWRNLEHYPRVTKLPSVELQTEFWETQGESEAQQS